MYQGLRPGQQALPVLDWNPTLMDVETALQSIGVNVAALKAGCDRFDVDALHEPPPPPGATPAFIAAITAGLAVEATGDEPPAIWNVGMVLSFIGACLRTGCVWLVARLIACLVSWVCGSHALLMCAVTDAMNSPTVSSWCLLSWYHV